MNSNTHTMIATIQFFSEVNYLAVFAAALAYFILGALWYSVLFGKIWAKGNAERVAKMEKPGKGMMGMMMVKSFLWNLLCAFAVAYLINAFNAYNTNAGLRIGLAAGAGLSLASLGMTANWQGTKSIVLIIDAGYQIIGVLIAAMIISCWH